MKKNFLRWVASLSVTSMLIITVCFSVLLVAGYLPSVGNMPTAAQHTALLALVMAILWATESLPVHMTAFLPVVALPFLGVETIAGTLGAAVQPGLLIFLGSYVAATAINHQELHKRLANQLIQSFGQSVQSVLAGLMFITAVFSMVMSNTTAALIMMPIGISLAGGYAKSKTGCNEIAGIFALGIAYSATIGGMVTLIGTPPNILTTAFLEANYNNSIGFSEWLIVSFPFAALLFYAAWKLLTLGAVKYIGNDTCAVSHSAQEKIVDKGLTPPQKKVLALVVMLLLGWITRPLVNHIIPQAVWNDVTISLLVAFLLWVLPAEKAKAGRLAPIGLFKKFPVPILFLFGGSLMLAHGFSVSGLASWLAQNSTILTVLPKAFIFFTFVLFVSVITEFMSNTASAAILLPVAAAIAEGVGIPPIAMVLAVCFAANAAFIMPIATAPNTIAFMTGHLRSRDMIRRGTLLNIFAAFSITVILYVMEITP